jgi:hypothetical protein
MDPIKDAIKEDKELQAAIAKTGRDFEFYWELLHIDEIAGLRILIKDPLQVVAFFKKIIHAMLRAYGAPKEFKHTTDDEKRHTINFTKGDKK